jgi:hypothetical protein
MIEVFQDQQPLLDNRMAFLAFDMGDKTNATGVVFVAWVVHTLCVHGALHSFFKDEFGG